jgi:arginase
MTPTKFHLLGCASGLAGADSHSGDGPLVVQASSYLTDLNQFIPYQWDFMLKPTENDALRIDESLANLYTDLAKGVSAAIQANQFFSVIGGDHSCAIGTWSGVYDALHQKGDIGLIWIDAHMDSHTPETSPSGNIHGMPLACLLGYGYPTLTGILHAAPKFKPENVCMIGIRNYESGEAELLKRLNVRIYFMDEVRERGFMTVIREAVKHVSRHTIGYGLTIDIDAIDPLEAPGVDVPEPEGIHAKDLCEGVIEVATDPRLIATEIVEFDPLHDKNQMTEKLMIALLMMIAQGKQQVTV